MKRIVAALLLLGAWPIQLEAQSLPPSLPPADQYCTSNVSQSQCFQTLAEAEHWMRTHPNWSAGLDFENLQFSRAEYGSGQAYRVYAAAPVEGRSISPTMYAGSFSSCGPHSPCGSEGEVIASVAARMAANYPGCQISEGQIFGDNTKVTNMSGSGANPTRISFTDYANGTGPHARRLETKVSNCPGGTPGHVLTVVSSLEKWQTFECPIESNYYRYSYNGPLSPNYVADPRWQAVYESGKWCQSNTKGTVSMSKRQSRTCSVGHPCHPSSGDKSRQEVDFTFAGREFSRSYHSLRLTSTTGSLGHGWTHIYQSRMNLSGLAVLTRDGNFADLVTISSNFYRVAEHEGVIVRKITSSQVLMIEPDGTTTTFNTVGFPTSIVNQTSPENDVSLLYSSADADAVLTAVVDRSGRQLQFGYQSGKLHSITLPDGQQILYQRDQSDGNLIAVTYPDGYRKEYYYDEAGLSPSGSAGLLTGISYSAGARYASFTYDGYERVVRSALHSGLGDVETTELSYSGQNQATVRDKSGAIWTYAFTNDTARRPVSFSTAGRQTVQSYHQDGQLASNTDGNGIVSLYGYGLQSSRIEAAGTSVERWTVLERDSFQRPIKKAIRRSSLVDGSIQTVAIYSITYDADGRVTAHCVVDMAAGDSSYLCGSQQAAPAGVQQSTRAYCTALDVSSGLCPMIGLLKSTDGPRTDALDTSGYVYYGSIGPACVSILSNCGYRPGDLWKVTNALGHVVETLRYDGAGRVLSTKDLNGVVTDYEYHPRGWLVATKIRGTNDGSDADDRITQIEYWPTGLVRKVTQPDGNFVTYEYDTAHRLTGIGDNAGNTITYTLDNAGNRVQEDTRDSGGTLHRTLSRLYNQLGQLATQADAGDNPTDFTYDPNGNLKTITDPLNRVTSNDYDPLNRLRRTLQDVGGIEVETIFEYDALDHLTKVTDPKGLETDYTYNAFGDLLQLDSPDTGTTTYTYDSAGNRISQVDARGVTSTYAYDALNRLTGISYSGGEPGAGALNVTYIYDTVQSVCDAGETYAIGRLSVMANASGSTQYCYDRFGQLVRKVQVTNGQTFTLRYAYTKSGQLDSLTYPDGTVVDYVRDAQGRITEVGVTGLAPRGGREVLLTGAHYAPFGPATGWAYGNGRTLSRTHDLDYRPESILDSAAGGLDFGFSYDPAGNLTALRTADLAEPPRARFEYDALSRLTAFKDGAVGATIESYAYDATGNRISFANSGGSQPYTYPTGSHRLTSVGGVSRSYDATGNTTAIGSTREFVYSAANRLHRVKQGGVFTTQYAYNGKGERVLRQHSGADDVITVYDEAGKWLGDYTGVGTPVQQAIWLDDLPVGLMSLQEVGGGKTLYYVQPDHLGTPRSVIDPVRNVAVWTWDLASEAFGASPPNQDPDNDGTNFVLDMRFPGQRYDAASGLNYNYFRDYEPVTGRYPQSDPIGLAGGPSTYGYAYQTPLITTDSSGLAGATGVIPWNPGAQPWLLPLGRQLLGILGRGAVLGGLYPHDMGHSSCEAYGVNFSQCMAEKYPTLPSSIMQLQEAAQCPEGEEEKHRQHCQALKNSILNTCARLSGRKQFQCFAAADKSYRQCMGYQ